MNAQARSRTQKRLARPASAGRRLERAHQAVEAIPPPYALAGERAARPAPEGAEFFPMVSVAHELKTPLVVMLGYTELLRGGRLGGINHRQGEVLDQIQRSGERLQSLIRDLLLLYELRAVPVAPLSGREAKATAVNERLREIFEYWEPLAKQKSIAYRFQPGPGTPRVGVDASRMQHIVSNLIENALKYSPAGGAVEISVAPCFWDRRRARTPGLFNLERKASRRTNNAVRVDVTDTGPGIPPDRHEDIFRDFVQLPGPAARGAGLGLAIARRLTAAHGGALWVESAPGKGSRFSLLLAQYPGGDQR